LTIQNTTTSQVRNLFSAIKVFISFCPWRAVAAAAAAAADFSAAAARAPTPPRPPFLGREVPKKIKSPVASAVALGHVCVGAGVVKGLIRW